MLEHACSLETISRWASIDSKVRIPAFQRGLVWKPRQVELLWDSILRGFPIGSFVLSEEADGCYYLMDGQQRFNAIALGYDTLSGAQEGPDAVLWMDIAPEAADRNTRKFWIKATTLAHPWGYGNDDECSTLSASQKREALEKYGISEDELYAKGVDLRKTYPFCAKRPFPLHYLLHAPVDTEEGFVESIGNSLRENKESYACLRGFDRLSPEDCSRLRALYPAFRQLKEYRVTFSSLSKNVVDGELKDAGVLEASSMTALEVLFTRLNTQGTQISQDDLRYSAIKAYWPEIKEENDRVAACYMSPSKLAMLVFRLAKSVEDKNDKLGFQAEMDIWYIRKLAQDPELKARVLRMYETRNGDESLLASMLRQIDAWFGIPAPDGMPRVLRTSMATHSPDLYLLLMWMAYSKVDLKPGFISGLALYLHWFAADMRKIVNLVYGRCLQQGFTEGVIRGAVADAVSLDYLVGLYSAEEMKRFFEIKVSRDWRVGNAEEHSRWYAFYERVAWQNRATREMLIYAQRKYINKHFMAYDPARQDLWAEQNRPWDFDHIVPQNWMSGQRGEYREYCKAWLNNIGNIAAIPFSVNREKSDKGDWEFYRQNAEDLFFEEVPVRPDLTFSQAEAGIFAEKTHERCCRIYGECYDAMLGFLNAVPDSGKVVSRKGICQDVQKALKEKGRDFRFYFVGSDGREERDYALIQEEDWSRMWISVAMPVEGKYDGKYMVSFTTSLRAEDDGLAYYELGLRRFPGAEAWKSKDAVRAKLEEVKDKFPGYEMDEGSWWLMCRIRTEKLQSADIVCELEKLAEVFG